MKKNSTYFAVVCFLGLQLYLVAGCASALTGRSAQSSLPVEAGIATTNTPPAVAWLQYAQLLNQAANPTPTAQPIGVALGALITIVSAAGGWLARHNATLAQGKTSQTGNSGPAPGS